MIRDASVWTMPTQQARERPNVSGSRTSVLVAGPQCPGRRSRRQPFPMRIPFATPDLLLKQPGATVATYIQKKDK
jgi:hypothetical protein